MKRYLLFLLLLVYGMSATGTSLYLHFCCGKLDDVSLTVQHQEGCSGEEKEEGEACCNSIAIDLKLDADQHPASKWVPLFTEPLMLHTPTPNWLAPVPPALSKGSQWANAPPGLSSACPVYIKNCVFRI